MRLVISFAACTINMDWELFYKVCPSDNKLNDIVNFIDSYNNKNSLNTYSVEKLYKIADDIVTQIEKRLDKVHNKYFYFNYDSYTIFKISQNKIYQVNDFDCSMDKEQAMHIFNDIFKLYYKQNLIFDSDFEDKNLKEDFIFFRINVFQKEYPMIVIEPKELSGNILKSNCWNFIARLIEENQNQLPFDDEDDDDSYYNDDTLFG